MATSGDIRDIMDLGHDGPRQPAPKKKKKLLETQPRLSGISREVQALMGDSVPPVAIVETPRYKQKPSITMKMFKPRHWEERQFVHAARKDGLQLRHWKRSLPGPNVPVLAVANSTSGDAEMTDENAVAPAVAELRFEDEFPSEKWNVEVPIKKYDDEQYEKFFKSEEWSKEETDYLMQLCQDYDLRWLLITDRYEPEDIPPKTDSNTTSPSHSQRRMEELKQRYYTIAAKMLELHTPASNMTQSEFQLWEKMRNFDARTEIQRKAMAEKLFERTKEEAEEEKVLLEELYRITKNEDDFIKMRKELYSRLETAPSLRRNERGEEPSTALYQTSQGLSMLLSSLLAKEKRLKPRVAPNGQEVASASQASADTQKARHGSHYNRRETMDSHAGDDAGPPSKKGSAAQAPVVRTLTPAEEVKFGVSHPQERLTSGVMFRHEKINRLTMAKSQVQTQKIAAALTELGIPPRLLMPTERVCREFERLVSEVQILLDTRRGLEKVSSEVKVLEEHKRLRLGGDQNVQEGGEGRGEGIDAMQVDKTNAHKEEQDRTGAGAAARQNVDATTAAQTSNKLESNKNTQQTQSADEDTVLDTQNNDDADVDDSQAQADDDDDEENEVDQSVVPEDDEDADDINQSYAQQEDEEEEEEEEGDQDEDEDDINIDIDDDEEDDEDDDDAPGLEALQRAHQVTDEEDEDGDDDDEDEEEEDNDVTQTQLVGDDEDEDEEADEDDNAPGVDESMMNGADEDDGAEEDDGGEARPTSSQSATNAHKRSASVLSDTSGAGRKRRK